MNPLETRAVRTVEKSTKAAPVVDFGPALRVSGGR
jgi:hypothetical protein